MKFNQNLQIFENAWSSSKISKFYQNTWNSNRICKFHYNAIWRPSCARASLLRAHVPAAHAPPCYTRAPPCCARAFLLRARLPAARAHSLLALLLALALFLALALAWGWGVWGCMCVYSHVVEWISNGHVSPDVIGTAPRTTTCFPMVLVYSWDSLGLSWSHRGPFWGFGPTTCAGGIVGSLTKHIQRILELSREILNHAGPILGSLWTISGSS
jgi:hypothetical protein